MWRNLLRNVLLVNYQIQIQSRNKIVNSRGNHWHFSRIFKDILGKRKIHLQCMIVTAVTQRKKCKYIYIWCFLASLRQWSKKVWNLFQIWISDVWWAWLDQSPVLSLWLLTLPAPITCSQFAQVCRDQRDGRVDWPDGASGLQLG